MFALCKYRANFSSRSLSSTLSRSSACARSIRSLRIGSREIDRRESFADNKDARSSGFFLNETSDNLLLGLPLIDASALAIDALSGLTVCEIN